MLKLAESARPINRVTMVNELDRRKYLAAIGEATCPLRVDGLPETLHSVRHYVDEVRGSAGLRCIVRVADSIGEQASNEPAATMANLEEAVS
jgi:replicative DNA helicase